MMNLNQGMNPNQQPMQVFELNKNSSTDFNQTGLDNQFGELDSNMNGGIAVDPGANRQPANGQMAPSSHQHSNSMPS